MAMNSDPAPQGAALAGWFDDSSAPEEVQALRAWVAGLSAELRQARAERDAARQALAAAHAEIARLQTELATLRAAGAPAPPAPAAPPTPRPHTPNELITVELPEAWAAGPSPPSASMPEPAAEPSSPDAAAGGPAASARDDAAPTNGTVAALPTLPLAPPLDHAAPPREPRRVRFLAAALVVLAAMALLLVAAISRVLP